MNRILLLLFSIILFSGDTLFAQSESSNNAFIMPITGTLGMTGSFGEIRVDHFHSGVDLRTENKIGKEVRSTNDGYVSRIKVSPVGYGKSIFIDHPNGLTSGYGHLDRYADQINSYVQKIQYQQKSFDVDIFLKPNEIPIKKGELIGYSGNSGGSSGPHLHYELRTTVDQRIINPIPHFLNIIDSISPIIKSLHVYRLDSSSYADGYSRKVDILVFRNHGEYAINRKVNASGKIGIGIDVFDRINYLSTQCGFKSISLSVNGKAIYNITLDKFAFAETKYVNSVIDYATRYASGKEIVKLYADPTNYFSGLRNLINKGYINIMPDSTYKIEILVSDASDNASKLSFTIFGINPPVKHETFIQSKDNCVLLSCMLDNTIINDTFILQISKYSLYNNLYFKHSTTSSSKYKYSPLIRLHNPQTPLHQKAMLEIKTSNLPVKYQSKALFATIDAKQNVVSAGGEWRNGYVKGSISSFGYYYVTLDTIAPEIIPINIQNGSNMTNSLGIQFKVKDDFSNMKKIDGYIDGQWVLFDYDLKNDVIFYKFDKERLDNKKNHNLEIVAIDNKNNENRYKCEFFW